MLKQFLECHCSLSKAVLRIGVCAVYFPRMLPILCPLLSRYLQRGPPVPGLCESNTILNSISSSKEERQCWLAMENGYPCFKMFQGWPPPFNGGAEVLPLWTNVTGLQPPSPKESALRCCQDEMHVQARECRLCRQTPADSKDTATNLLMKP